MRSQIVVQIKLGKLSPVIPDLLLFATQTFTVTAVEKAQTSSKGQSLPFQRQLLAT